MCFFMYCKKNMDRKSSITHFNRNSLEMFNQLKKKNWTNISTKLAIKFKLFYQL